MKKIYLISFSVLSLILLSFGIIYAEGGIVQCGQNPANPCGFSDLCKTAQNLMNIIIVQIGSALAFLFLTIGGIILLISGGNPELKSLGKKILKTTIIGLALVLGARAIIGFILTSLGSIYGIDCK